MSARFTDHLLEGTHAELPAASAAPKGALFSCTDHGLIYKNGGETWATWATLGDTTTAAALADHLADTTDAHDASAISFASTAFTATEVQAALVELEARVAALEAAAAPATAEFVAAVQDTSGTVNGTNTETLPAHQSGDILIATLDLSGHSTVPSTPSGWTLLDSMNSCYVWWKVGNGTETSLTYSWSSGTTASVFAAVAYRGATLVEKVVVSTTDTSTASDAGADVLVVYVVDGLQQQFPPAMTSPAEVTQRVNAVAQYWASVVIADEPPVDGTVPARTFTNGDNVRTLALRA